MSPGGPPRNSRAFNRKRPAAILSEDRGRPSVVSDVSDVSVWTNVLQHQVSRSQDQFPGQVLSLVLPDLQGAAI